MSIPVSYVLGIESAIGGGSLSLHRDGVEIDASSGEDSVARAEQLLPRIDAVLQNQNITIRDIDLVIVSTGPGSYTGIRVGIATALGLRASLKARVLGITVLEAMSLTAQKSDTRVLTAVSMGRSMVCSQVFEHTSGGTTPMLETTEQFVEAAISFNGSVIVHKPLADAIRNIGQKTVFDLGDKLATIIAKGASSDFASENLTPLFVDRQ
jgi:tRNA threonylcarbamoyl adenosine modification protein YeaZ